VFLIVPVLSRMSCSIEGSLIFSDIKGEFISEPKKAMLHASHMFKNFDWKYLTLCYREDKESLNKIKKESDHDLFKRYMETAGYKLMTVLKDYRRYFMSKAMISAFCNLPSLMEPMMSSDISFISGEESMAEFLIDKKFRFAEWKSSAEKDSNGQDTNFLKKADCSKFNTQQDQSFSNLITWTAYGSDDPTSDYDISLNVVPKNQAANDIVSVLKRLLQSNRIAMDVREKVAEMAFEEFSPLYVSDRSMEDVFDTNIYPDILAGYQQYFRKDPTIEESAAYFSFLASFEFSICQSANLPLLDSKIQKMVRYLVGESSPDFINFKKYLYDECQLFSGHLVVKKNPLYSQPSILAFNEAKEKLIYHIFDRDVIEADVDSTPSKFPERHLLRIFRIESFERSTVADCQKCFSFDVKSELDYWPTFALIPSCLIWSVDASLTYGSLEVYANLPDPQSKKPQFTPRALAQSTMENLTHCIVHITEEYIHISHEPVPPVENVSDKFKYLIRVQQSLSKPCTLIDGREVQNCFDFPKKLDAKYDDLMKIYNDIMVDIEANQFTPKYDKKTAYFKAFKTYQGSAQLGATVKKLIETLLSYKIYLHNLLAAKIAAIYLPPKSSAGSKKKLRNLEFSDSNVAGGLKVQSFENLII